jgi:outer membrane protein OmpA-like peptidoglycan-associated protein
MSGPLVSQVSLNEANALFREGCYARAYPVYLEEIKKHPNDAQLNYRMGVCLLNSRSMKSRSTGYLRKAAAGVNPGDTAKVPYRAYRQLGDAYFHNRQFDSAQIAYEKYKTMLDPGKPADAVLLADLARATEICKVACEIRDESIALPISKKFPMYADISDGDYSSELSTDRQFMIHTLKVPVSAPPRDESEKYFESMAAPKTTETLTPSKAKKITNGTGLDTILYSTTIGSSIDGQIILTYRNENNDGTLYLSRLSKNKWTVPEKLKKPANPAGWEPCEYVTPDGSTMYFVSSRKGGFGGYDIYRCVKNTEGKWSKAVNLGAAINSKYDDVAPYMHPDGTTLYFSSNRVKPGTFDIFTSSLAGKTWSEPQNVGFPINRKNDDIFQVVEGKRKQAPAKEENPKQKEKKEIPKDTTIEKDNFIVTVVNQNNSPLTLLVGEVSDNGGKSLADIRLRVSDNENGQPLGEFTTNEKGRYALILNSGKNHNIIYEGAGFLFHTENVRMTSDNKQPARRQEIRLQPLQKNSKTTLNNIFFDPGKPTLSAGSKTELEHVLKFLNDHPDATISMNHWIISKENKKENKKLAKERAEKLAAYLTAKGISRKRIDSDGGRMSSLPGVKKKKKKNDKKETEKTIELTELEIKTIN